jgi:hypothetical protein
MSPLRPLEQWSCDTCKQLIQEPKHGYVEWHSAHDAVGPHGFLIVHHAPRSPRQPHGKCYQYDDSFDQHTLELPYFLGTEGIVLLLSLIDVGRVHDPDRNQRPAGDLREFAEFFRRLQLPYYEEARHYFERAYRDGYLDGANEVLVYQPDSCGR